MRLLTLLLLTVAMLWPTMPAGANGVDWVSGFIEADGYATVNKNMPESRAKLMSARAARADAYRCLLELVQQVRLDGDLTVADCMNRDGAVTRQISGYVQGAEVLREEQLYDGTTHVIVRAPLYGVTGLTSIIALPEDAAAQNEQNAQIVLREGGDGTLIANDDIVASLDWFRAPDATDEGVKLGLGCFYATDLQSGVLDAMSGNLGQYDQSPFIAVDDKLTINGSHLDGFHHIYIYAYIPSGPRTWSELDAVLTIAQQGSSDVVVRLDTPNPSGPICLVAAIDKTDFGRYKVTKLVNYYYNLGEIDAAMNGGA